MYNKPITTIDNAEHHCCCNMLLPDALQVDMSKGQRCKCRNRCGVLFMLEDE